MASSKGERAHGNWPSKGSQPSYDCGEQFVSGGQWQLGGAEGISPLLLLQGVQRYGPPAREGRLECDHRDVDFARLRLSSTGKLAVDPSMGAVGDLPPLAGIGGALQQPTLPQQLAGALSLGGLPIAGSSASSSVGGGSSACLSDLGSSPSARGVQDLVAALVPVLAPMLKSAISDGGDGGRKLSEQGGGRPQPDSTH